MRRVWRNRNLDSAVYRPAARLGAGITLIIALGVASAGYLTQHVLATIADAEYREDAAPPPVTRVMALRILKEQADNPAGRAQTIASMPVDAPAPPVASKATVQPTKGDSPAAAMPDPAHANPVATVRGMTYRTVCVRECDGGYFPISFSTTSRYFERDAAACTHRCGVPARLFVYPNDGGSPATMVDLQGQPYSALANANVYQSERRPACSCRAEPWSQEAEARRRIDVLKAEGEKLDAAGRKELQLLAAVEEVRRLRPGGLAALRLGHDEAAGTPKRSMPLPGDRVPLVGGKDNEQPAIVMNFEAPLQPATVVHDATGRAVVLKPAPKHSAPPAVTVIATAPDVVAIPPLTVAALPDEAKPDTIEGLGPSPAGRSIVKPSLGSARSALKGSTEPQQALKAGSAGRKTAAARAKAIAAKVAEAHRPGSSGAGRTASAGDWYGQRLYTGNDWRLTTYQMLE